MQRHLQGGNVGLHRRVSLVADRSNTGIDTVRTVATATARTCRDALSPGVVVGERQIFSARRSWVAFLPRRDWLQREAVEAIIDIPKEAFLALLTIADNIDPDFDLLADHVGHGLAHQPGEDLCIVRLTTFLQAQQGNEGLGPCQAANVCGQDAVGTLLHVALLCVRYAAPVAASPLPAPALTPRAARSRAGRPRPAPGAWPTRWMARRASDRRWYQSRNPYRQ